MTFTTSIIHSPKREIFSGSIKLRCSNIITLYVFEQIKYKGLKKMEKEKVINVRSIALIGMMVAVMAVCSWISIPSIVPFTLQTFAIFLSIALLGGARGTISVLVYILLGAIGLPVFAGFSGGIGTLLGATGGYIIGFLATALIMWGIEKLFGKNIVIFILSAILGSIVCYVIGTYWFIKVYTATKEAVTLTAALGWCVYPFLIPDFGKIILAAFIGKRIQKATNI